MSDQEKQKILTFFQTYNFGVISTNSKNGLAPESAVVAFSYTENLEIIFGSFITTRKNVNIKNNSKVSFVVGWDNTNKTTIQVEGDAIVLEGEDRIKAQQEHCRRNIESQKYINDSRQQYFKIVPYWIRYSNFSFDPQEVWEVNM